MPKRESEPVVEIFLFLRILEVENRVPDEGCSCFIVALKKVFLDNLVLFLEKMMINTYRVMIGLYYLN